MLMLKKQQGFTIVELLIVIVVIGILAAIVIVAYNGVQQRARDTKRISDIGTIVSALEVYRIYNGNYPASAAGGAFELSTTDPANFISALKTGGAITTATPVDPRNTSPYYFRYFRYPAGFYGCDATRGVYYVLVIQTLEGKAGTGHGPGFACGTQDFVSFGAWVTGRYLD